MNTVGEGGGGHASRGWCGGSSPARQCYADFLVLDFFASDFLLLDSDVVELPESDDFDPEDFESEDFESEDFESVLVDDEPDELSDFSPLRRDEDGLSVR